MFYFRVTHVLERLVFVGVNSISLLHIIRSYLELFIFDVRVTYIKKLVLPSSDRVKPKTFTAPAFLFVRFPLAPTPPPPPPHIRVAARRVFLNYNPFPGLWTGFLSRLGCGFSLHVFPPYFSSVSSLSSGSLTLVFF